jgi:hypothetical protein
MHGAVGATGERLLEQRLAGDDGSDRITMLADERQRAEHLSRRGAVLNRRDADRRGLARVWPGILDDELVRERVLAERGGDRSQLRLVVDAEHDHYGWPVARAFGGCVAGLSCEDTSGEVRAHDDVLVIELRSRTV